MSPKKPNSLSIMDSPSLHALENLKKREKVASLDKLTRDNLMLLELSAMTGQILLLLTSQSGLLELDWSPLQKLLKRLMLKLENGLERAFLRKLKNQ